MNNFKHKKSLGQNFLKDNKVLEQIKNSVEVSNDDLIIEIGPGQGALTKYLKTINANLLCFEIDERLRNDLVKLEDDKTKIIFEDFLNVDIKEVLSNYNYKNLYVIANLPYYITTPIISKIIDSGIDVKEMVFMVQDEVANRFTSNPGVRDYGSITIFFNYYFEVEKLFFVGRKSFDPVPNVDSAVIKFKRREEKLEVFDLKLFFKLVRDAFQFKRKNLRNNLRNYDLQVIEVVLMRYNLDLTVRAEQLGIEIFVEIANCLYDSTL